ncbi:MAG: 30S ribosomal protein S3, partial [Anaerovoracaceae bacterium]
EVRRTEMDAQLTAESIAQALERRISFRRAMKQAIGRTMKAGAKGIKVLVSGRLGGAEIARSEKYSEGNVPLHTLRADIDYGFAEADTTYGKLGVKVWINHGEILDKGLQSAIREEKQDKRDGRKPRRDGDRRPRRDNDRKPRRDGDRKPRRDEKPELPKAINPRVRNTPKPDPQAEAEAKAKAEEAARLAAEAEAQVTEEVNVEAEAAATEE